MQAPFSHPEGATRQIVRELNRGRWQCRDAVECVASSTDSKAPLPASCVDDGTQTPTPGPACRTFLQDSKLDVSSGEKSPQHKARVEEEEEEREEDEGEKDCDNNATITTTTEQEAVCVPDLSAVLDSNFNASPRRPRCRVTKTGHTTESDRGTGPETGWPRMQTGSDVGVVVVLMAAAALVMSPYLVPHWSFSLLCQWMCAIGRLVTQVVAVLVSTAGLLIVLQAHYPSDRLRQWVAGVFQLEMKEPQSDHKTKIPTVEEVPLSHTLTTTTGDGDKESASSPSPPSSLHEDRPVQKPTETIPGCVIEKETNPRGCTENVQTEPTNEREGDREGQDHVTPICGGKIGQGKCHREAMKSMYRKYLQIRRKYRTEMSSLRQTDKAASQVLSRVQLTLPVLEKEKQALLAELEAIHKQHEEERRRNHDLLVRLHRLNQQFVRIGVPQGNAATPRTHSQEHSHFNGSSGLTQQPNHNLRHRQYHNYHQQQQQQQPQQQPQQQQSGRVGSATLHNASEDMKAECAHNVRPSLCPASVNH